MRRVIAFAVLVALYAGVAEAKKRKPKTEAEPAPAATESAPANPTPQAAPPPEPLPPVHHYVPRSAGFAPRPGSWQIFVSAPPIAVQNYAGGFYEPHGLAANFGSVGGTGFSQFGFGINGGLGYVASDLLEYGGAVGIDVGSTSALGGSLTAYQFVLEPLVKFNMGSRWHWADHLNPFGFAGLPIGFGGTSAASGFTLGFELAGGVEYMFGDHFGIDGFVPLDFVVQTGSPSTFVFSLGLEYGLTIYF